MKKFILFYVLISIVYTPLFSQVPSWMWAKSAGGENPCIGYKNVSVAVDASGNAYLAGYFTGDSITFGGDTLTNAGGDNIFLAKYDAVGNVIWAKKAGGTNNDLAYSVAADAQGNAYITGSFGDSTFIFGSTTLTNPYPGSDDIFLAKYDTYGNVLWAKDEDGTGGGTAKSVAVDASGNCYITGSIGGTNPVFDTETMVESLEVYVYVFDFNSSEL